MAGSCASPGKVCKDSFDCPPGFFCEPTLGRCLPQPTGTKCEVKPPAVAFKPKVEWTWQGYSKDLKFHEVAVAPAIADVDADGTPEVVFVAYHHSSKVTSKAMLVMLDGKTGKEELTLPTSNYNFSRWSGVAVGNLDADKQLEIVAIELNKGLMVFEHDGKVKWTQSSGSLGGIISSKFHPYPAIADLNGDGSPEIIVGGVVVSASGKVLFDKGLLGKNSSSVISTAADLDEDGKLELVGGNAAYDHTGKLVWKSAAPDGFAAVADMDHDGWADVINVSGGYVRVLRGKDGKVIFGPVAIPGGGYGGAATVGDFDNDGRPEFSAAGKGKYAVYDLDCKAGGSKKYCPSGSTNGILWSVTTQDISSSTTGSSLFDFEGDGTVEVVYNDECHLYVLDGKTGKTLMKVQSTSQTAAEYPLIADVDGDGNSEFVIPANDAQIVRDKCKPPGTRGITVFGDSMDRWVGTRSVWNQHTYHLTNVTASGQIPAKEERNWDKKGLNNFRQNAQGAGVFNAPDLTVSLEAKLSGCPKSLLLRARVTNSGSLGVKKGYKVAFYRVSPAGPLLLGTRTATKDLIPGYNEVVTLTFKPPAGVLGPFDFQVKADDDGTGKGTVAECNENNNTAGLTGVKCFVVR